MFQRKEAIHTRCSVIENRWYDASNPEKTLTIEINVTGEREELGEIRSRLCDKCPWYVFCSGLSYGDYGVDYRASFSYTGTGPTGKSKCGAKITK